mmetsp:Transcript_7428/g.24635  ORF Transcript_7428/g.24635 Transcript_7428/m.24635 type:complete len:210 (-) Transcript_7428:2-631(-)
MRRRQGDSAAFYKRYARGDPHGEDEARKSTGRQTAHSACLRLRLYARGTMAALAHALAAWRGLLHHQVPSEGDPDVLLACVDCGAAFSLFSRWRVECEHCHNVFCHDCLSLRHELFDGVRAGSGRTRRRVCSYCFFQLCARHCKARCCADLPIRTLRRFLARKGISTRGAIEKGDLVQSVYSWALDLAAFESEELLASARGSVGGDEMV